MKVFLLGSMVIGGMALLAGCGDVGDAENPHFDPAAKVEKIDTAAMGPVLQEASRVAQTATGGWESLSEDQKKPFLSLNGGDENKAKSHYATLVENEKDIQANLKG